VAGAERLHQYWVHGEGAAKIRWGTPGDFDRCTRQLEEHAHFTPEQAHGYCNLAHHAATGMYPATHAALEHGHRSAAMADSSKPYGDVTYADPGYQKDGKKRYPIDTADHVRAAWSYINQADNAAQYTAEQLAAIKGRIRAAAKRLGVEIAADTQNRAAAGVVYIPSVVYTRDSSVAAVNTKQRVIDVLAVPWDKETDDPVPFEEGMYRERFAAGAFDHLEGNPGRISVNVGHNRADPIGKVENLNVRHPAGLLAQLKIASIPRGDDVLQLAEEGMLSPSIGYYTKPGGYRKSRRAGVVEVRMAWLDHIGLVGVPAYSGAQVIDVRQPGAPTIEVPSAGTPFLDEFLNDPVVQWVHARVPRGRE